MKGAPSADFSVATVWLGRGDNSFLLEVWRERVDYPNLKRAVLWMREKYPNATLLIEDKGSGTSLIQDLRANNIAVIGINPRGRQTDAGYQDSALFEAGSVFFPKNAPWLSSLKAELLGFPSVKYDDQVDRSLRRYPGSGGAVRITSLQVIRLSSPAAGSISAKIRNVFGNNIASTRLLDSAATLGPPGSTASSTTRDYCCGMTF